MPQSGEQWQDVGPCRSYSTTDPGVIIVARKKPVQIEELQGDMAVNKTDLVDMEYDMDHFFTK